MGQAREAGQGILITLVGILLLVTVGFVIGLVVGVVSEEPELVVVVHVRVAEADEPLIPTRRFPGGTLKHDPLTSPGETVLSRCV